MANEKHYGIQQHASSERDEYLFFRLEKGGTPADAQIREAKMV
jgi:hypothetical protein